MHGSIDCGADLRCCITIGFKASKRIYLDLGEMRKNLAGK